MSSTGFNFLNVLIVLVPMLLAVAFMTIIERKVLAAMQRRVGPDTVGIYGIAQPFAATFLFIILNIIIIHTFGFEPADFSELFNNFLSVFNLIYSAVVELGYIAWNPLLLVSSVVPTKPEGKPRLSQAERDKFELTEILKEVLVGCLLGDLHCRDRNKTGNITLYFEQGGIHKEYIFHLFDLFEGYCSSSPKIYDRQPDKRTGKVYTRIVFTTYSLPCFNYLYKLFYHGGKKLVENLIPKF